MARTFISFLGAISYQATRYYQQPDRSDLGDPMYYVQEAILSAQGEPWGPDDKIWIFTTKEARKTNYEGRLAGKSEVLPGEGLKSALQRLQENSRIAHFESVEIPNGYSTEEMWTVFERVFKKLRPGDELHLDVTFGFRSLPMLATILVNYARTLKQIRVKAIYYGVFEAGRQERIAENENRKALGLPENSDPAESPIIDLNVFSELQDWTYAAQTFLDAGNSSALSRLTQDKHPGFSAGILGFSQAILTCRGADLVQTEDIDGLKNQIGELGQDSGLQAQLRPLLEKVGEKIGPFRSGTLQNGFAAVQWCIDHGMVQQGITFLQETVVSWVVESVVGRSELNNPVYRFAANGALNLALSADKTLQVHKEDIKSLGMEESEIRTSYQKMCDLVTPALSRKYKNLTGHKGFRNDINHCGFRDAPLSPAKLKENLERLFTQIKPLLHVD